MSFYLGLYNKNYEIKYLNLNTNYLFEDDFDVLFLVNKKSDFEYIILEQIYNNIDLQFKPGDIIKITNNIEIECHIYHYKLKYNYNYYIRNCFDIVYLYNRHINNKIHELGNFLKHYSNNLDYSNIYNNLSDFINKTKKY